MYTIGGFIYDNDSTVESLLSDLNRTEGRSDNIED
jgi:hypothetical protein